MKSADWNSRYSYQRGSDRKHGLLSDCGDVKRAGSFKIWQWGIPFCRLLAKTIGVERSNVDSGV